MLARYFHSLPRQAPVGGQQFLFLLTFAGLPASNTDRAIERRCVSGDVFTNGGPSEPRLPGSSGRLRFTKTCLVDAFI